MTFSTKKSIACSAGRVSVSYTAWSFIVIEGPVFAPKLMDVTPQQPFICSFQTKPDRPKTTETLSDATLSEIKVRKLLLGRYLFKRYMLRVHFGTLKVQISTSSVYI